MKVRIYYIATNSEWFISRHFETKKQAISFLKDYLDVYPTGRILRKTFRLEKESTR